MTLATTIALTLIGIAAALHVARIVRPGSGLADRVLGLDTLLIAIVSGSAVLAARTGETVFLDLVVVTSLVGFVSSLTVARIVEARGNR